MYCSWKVCLTCKLTEHTFYCQCNLFFSWPVPTMNKYMNFIGERNYVLHQQLNIWLKHGIWRTFMQVKWKVCDMDKYHTLGSIVLYSFKPQFTWHLAYTLCQSHLLSLGLYLTYKYCEFHLLYINMTRWTLHGLCNDP